MADGNNRDTGSLLHRPWVGAPTCGVPRGAAPGSGVTLTGCGFLGMWPLQAVHSQTHASPQQAAPAPLPSDSFPQGYGLPAVLLALGGPQLP